MEYKIETKDIPQELASFANLVGYDMFIKICEEYGGNQIYFPKKESIYRKYRDREIRKKYNGTNSSQLSREFRLTVNQINKIVK